jgi:hypothetical protein
MRSTRDIRLVTAVVLVLGAALGVLAAGPAQAKSIVVLPRPGQVGVSASGLYGTLLDGANLGDQFSSGAGMAVRVRYRMRYERGIGLSFENHGFDPRNGDSLFDYVEKVNRAQTDSLAYKKANLYLYGVDFYQFFGTRTKTTKMLSLGAGIAHVVLPSRDNEQQYPFNDGAYLSAGAGVERFFWQSVAFDFGARYQALFIDGKVNHDIQFSAGFIMYASL